MSSEKIMKRCTGCGNEYPATPEYFHRHSRTKDGLKPRCKTCSLAWYYNQPQPEWWLRALDYWGNRCAVCGREANGMSITVAKDHWWVAAARGGKLTANNVLPLCNGRDCCNTVKNDRDSLEWLFSTYGLEEGHKKLARIIAYFAWVNEQDGGG